MSEQQERSVLREVFICGSLAVLGAAATLAAFQALKSAFAEAPKEATKIEQKPFGP